MTELPKIKKIILVGLDNGGKTSLVLSLKGNKNLPAFKEIKPSKGKWIEPLRVMDSEFSIWDLGGQENYREEYLNNFDDYIRDTKKLIFVFDIQDVKRYDLAVEYFDKVIELLDDKVSSENFEISVFLHKFDPDSKIIFPEITNEIIHGLKERIKEILKKRDFYYQIYKTTIFARFEKRLTD